jgi:N6-adenosine-specific RNA methylase IME4
MAVKYRTIVADPPWEYPDPFGGHNAGGKGRVVRRKLPYQSMTVAEIADLKIADLADTAGANLFLWTTNRYLPAAFGVLASWGAVYRQTLIWHKTGANPLSGSVAPTACEFLLFARIGAGAPIARPHWDSPLVTTKRLANSHSRKPEVFLDLIEQVSPGPYLEMFARRARFGWDYYGDESLGTAEVAA